MIYCTLAYGSYIDKYYNIIINAGKKHDIHVLTEKPDIFKNVKTYEYPRKDFSYYEKLIFIVKLVIENKQRVNYIDADMMWDINSNIQLDDTTIYSYQILDIESDTIENVIGKEKINQVFKNAKWNTELKDYIPEAIISIPYLPIMDKMLEDLLYLQPYFEDFFNKKNAWNQKTYRYGKYGVGYGEGAALTAIANKYNIPYKGLSRTAFANKMVL